MFGEGRQRRGSKVTAAIAAGSMKKRGSTKREELAFSLLPNLLSLFPAPATRGERVAGAIRRRFTELSVTSTSRAKRCLEKICVNYDT